jgi:hypothetical protein
MTQVNAIVATEELRNTVSQDRTTAMVKQRTTVGGQKTDWTHGACLDPDAATELYRTLLAQPGWRHADGDPSESSIHYGLSFTVDGGASDGEIPEIPSWLQRVADQVSAHPKVGMPANFVQCHRIDPDGIVSPHVDPKQMIVPMIVAGHERTFRVGGTVIGKNGKSFPPMASQASMARGTHVPEEEILLTHGSLLVFDGGRTLHSMLPAANDERFNPNGFETRISILFRWTTPAMREYDTRGAVKHGSLEQYEQAKREYRQRVGWDSNS